MLNTGILKELKLLRGNYKMYEPKNNIYVIKGKDGQVKKIIGKKEDLPVMRGLALLTMKAPTHLEIQESMKRICNPDCKSEYLGKDESGSAQYKVTIGNETRIGSVGPKIKISKKYNK